MRLATRSSFNRCLVTCCFFFKKKKKKEKKKKKKEKNQLQSGRWRL
jgi:hypothetical protein